jgi:hypothetical protein
MVLLTKYACVFAEDFVPLYVAYGQQWTFRTKIPVGHRRLIPSTTCRLQWEASTKFPEHDSLLYVKLIFFLEAVINLRNICFVKCISRIKEATLEQQTSYVARNLNQFATHNCQSSPSFVKRLKRNDAHI